MTNEDQPGRAIGAEGIRTIVFLQHAPNDVSIELNVERISDLLGNTYIAELGIAGLQRNDRGDQFWRRIVRTRLASIACG